MTFVDGPVRVSVPATTANLGPGFDCLGLALDAARRARPPRSAATRLVVEVTGEGADDVPRDERTWWSARCGAAFARDGRAHAAGLRLSCPNRIPHAPRARLVVGGDRRRASPWRAALVEGGSDWLGRRRRASRSPPTSRATPTTSRRRCSAGFVVCGQDDEDVWADQARRRPAGPGGGLRAARPGCRPRSPAACCLPTVPHADAAANAGRAALLVAALGGQPEQLLRATEDFLHQDYRRPAMPESLALVDRLRADGHAAVVSGAGPTVLVLTVERDLGPLAACVPRRLALPTLDVATEGVPVGCDRRADATGAVAGGL